MLNGSASQIPAHLHHTMTDRPDTRIVHVPRRFVAHEWGGTETVILEISKQQQLAGLDPVIVTSMALAKTAREEIGGVAVERYSHRYPFFGLSETDRAAMDKKGGNLLSLPLMAALLKQPDVRLFHAHALKRLGGTVRTAARWRKRPYVVSLHGGVYDVPLDEMADLTRPIEGKFEWGRVFGALLGARKVLEDADHVICVGQAEAEKAKAALPHSRVSYLPNGVDSARFTQGHGPRFREAHGIAPDAFVVLSVSRIDSQKNQLALVEAFSALKEQVPAAHLVLIGPETQPAYAEKIRTLAGERGVTQALTMIPGLANDSGALTDAYHAADVFVLPSRHEPFGIVVLEAWCAARPVVVSRVGGLRALVREGESGLFFDPDSTEHLTRQLLALHADPARRTALGQAGRQEALTRYDWKRIAARLETIYQEAEAHAARRWPQRRAC